MTLQGKTDIGKLRKLNEDAFDFGTFADGACWAVVCDGMGGAKGGQVASGLAVQTIRNRFETSYRPEMDARSVRNLLLCAAEAANAAILARAKEDETLTGMGTTAVAAIICGSRVSLLHVGDSRAYLLDGAEIRQLTRDHSVVQELVESGKITQEDAHSHPQKNIITKALGVVEPLSYDYDEVELPAGAKLLLCTDGLTNMLRDEEILEISKQEDIAETLVQRAVELGGVDNVTVVLACL